MEAASAFAKAAFGLFGLLFLLYLSCSSLPSCVRTTHASSITSVLCISPNASFFLKFLLSPYEIASPADFTSVRSQPRHQPFDLFFKVHAVPGNGRNRVPAVLLSAHAGLPVHTLAAPLKLHPAGAGEQEHLRSRLSRS